VQGHDKKERGREVGRASEDEVNEGEIRVGNESRKSCQSSFMACECGIDEDASGMNSTARVVLISNGV